MKGGWTGGEAGEKPAASQPLSFFFSCHHPTPLAGGHLDGAERCERTHVVETEPRTHQRELRGFPFFLKIKIKHQRKERFKCLSSNGRGIYLYFFLCLDLTSVESHRASCKAPELNSLSLNRWQCTGAEMAKPFPGVLTSDFHVKESCFDPCLLHPFISLFISFCETL